MANQEKISLLDELKTLLGKDKRFIADGLLLKNTIVEHALKLDKDLIKRLLSKKQIKEHFFCDIDGTLVFDKDKFISFVDNKQFLPDSYTAFKNKIGLTLDGKDDYLKERKDVTLVWPYKDCVLEGGQTKEDQKRNEIFWNETLAPDEIDLLTEPKVLTNFKRFDKDGEHKASEVKTEDNLIIKGNNLLALHSLKKKFAGKVKLIYIDPPYNTGGDTEAFTYNNSFKHSTWLTFIKNRLEIAKAFLRIDGFIAITIDHVELFYLGTLADDIFGRENRVGIVSIVHKPEGRNQEKFFGTSNEFMLVYAKNKQRANFEKVVLDTEQQERFDEEDEKGKYRLKNFIRLTDGKYSLRENKPSHYYPIYISKDLTKFSIEKIDDYEAIYPITESGVERTWKTKGGTFKKLEENGNIVAKREKDKVVIYEKLREDQVIKTHWIKKEYHAYHFGTKLLEQILGEKAFSFPKSLYAVLDTIKIMTSQDDIILDFFSGSGTTAHAVLELNKEDGGNRKFIIVEQLDEHIGICQERLQKVIKNNSQGDFVYCELLKWNEAYIDKIQRAKTKADLAKIWAVMREKAHISYKIDIKKIDETTAEFEKLDFEDQRRFLLEVLDKNQLYVNYCEIDDTDYKISTEDKKLNRLFYGGK